MTVSCLFRKIITLTQLQLTHSLPCCYGTHVSILQAYAHYCGQMLFLNYPKMFAIVRYCVRFANVNNLCHCLFWANVQDVHIHQLLNILLFSRQLLPKRNTFSYSDWRNVSRYIWKSLNISGIIPLCPVRINFCRKNCWTVFSFINFEC